MPRSLIALLLLPAVAVAADPDPKAAKTLEEVYGTATDAKSKAKFVQAKTGELIVSVPKDAPEERYAVPPTVGRVVEGDFVLRVRITHQPPSVQLKKAGRALPSVAAGVALHPDGEPGTVVAAVREHSLEGGKWVSHRILASDLGDFGQGGKTTLGTTLDDKPVYLRVNRRGPLVTAELSGDGKKWTEIGQQPVLKLGKKVVVGPVVYHGTDAETSATFDEYSIEPLAEKKK